VKICDWQYGWHGTTSVSIDVYVYILADDACMEGVAMRPPSVRAPLLKAVQPGADLCPKIYGPNWPLVGIF
jgi:hypothetical protein